MTIRPLTNEVLVQVCDGDDKLKLMKRTEAKSEIDDVSIPV